MSQKQSIEIQNGGLLDLRVQPSLPPPISRLPVELLDLIFDNIPTKKDLSTLQLVSRSLKQLTSPKLYHTYNITTVKALQQLFNMSRDLIMVAAIKSVDVKIPASELELEDFVSWANQDLFQSAWAVAQSSLLAISLSHLVNLQTLSIHGSPAFHLTFGIQVAIASHPTLKTLHFDSWELKQNDFRPLPTRRPVGSPPLFIPAISLSSLLLKQYDDDFDNFLDTASDEFLFAFSSFVEACNVQVGTLNLRVLKDDIDFFNAFVPPFDQYSVSPNLPGLQTLHFECTGRWDDPVMPPEWLSFFLSEHLSLTRLEFSLPSDNDEPTVLQVPLEELGRVRGLEMFGQRNGVADFLGRERLSELAMDVAWVDGRGWTVSGLMVESSGLAQYSERENRVEITSALFVAINELFPHLERLEFVGDFFVKADLLLNPQPIEFQTYTDFLSSLPSFPHLKHLYLPCSSLLLFEHKFCTHNFNHIELQWNDKPRPLRYVELKSRESPCLVGKRAVDRIPGRTMDAWTALAKRMVKLESLWWEMRDWDYLPGESLGTGGLKWRVDRKSKEGRVRLVDDGSLYESFERSHTGLDRHLRKILGGDLDLEE